MLVSQLNLGRGYPLVIFCHIVLVLPFVLRSVYVSLKNLEQRIELAAASLGHRRCAWYGPSPCR
jgi:putative spermidine/putrescine transport system permease protein